MRIKNSQKSTYLGLARPLPFPEEFPPPLPVATPPLLTVFPPFPLIVALVVLAKGTRAEKTNPLWPAAASAGDGAMAAAAGDCANVGTGDIPKGWAVVGYGPGVDVHCIFDAIPLAAKLMGGVQLVEVLNAPAKKEERKKISVSER